MPAEPPRLTGGILTIGNLICLSPRDSYVVDSPIKRKGFVRWLETRTGPFVRSPGIAFPYLIGFLRKNGVLSDDTRLVVQHDRIEGPTSFEEILADKADLSRGDCDVLFLTAYTDSVREAYRRAREARAAYASAGKRLVVVLGGAHASALPDEATRLGHADATVAGEGEWAAAELLADVREGRAIKPLYRAPFSRIRDRGTLAIDMGIWRGLKNPPHQVLASTHFARGCKLDCHFCAVFLTNGPTVRNRDVADVAEEIRNQGPTITRETIDQIGPGVYNSILRALVKTPIVGKRWGDRLISLMGPGYSDQVFFWDDNLYNAAGSTRALFEAIRPLGRPWAAELTIDIAEKPELLKLAYESGCRNLFMGIESVNQTAIDGLNKWSNDTTSMADLVKRVHDAGIRIMGSFVFGLDGDDATVFDRTLEFINRTGIDLVVANIIQPYPGTGTFRDAVAGADFLPCATAPADSDVAMDFNWPLFDGAHVLVRPKGMTVRQLQEGYYYFLREAYSLTGITRRFRREGNDPGGAAVHFARNYIVSRYGMVKTAHALRWSNTPPVIAEASPDGVASAEPGDARPVASPGRVVPEPGDAVGAGIGSVTMAADSEARALALGDRASPR